MKTVVPSKEELEGRKVTGVARRGKFVVLSFEGGLRLLLTGEGDFGKRREAVGQSALRRLANRPAESTALCATAIFARRLVKARKAR